MSDPTDFGRYEILSLPLRGSLRDMSRKELTDYYECYLGQIANRISMLRGAVNHHGLPRWTANHTPDSLPLLGHWLQAHLALRSQARGALTGEHGRPGADELTETSLSLCVDAGMYVSSVFTTNCSTLEWHQPLGSKMDVDYGQPVLQGFGAAPFNASRMLITFGYALVSGKRTGSDLLKLYSTWRSLVVSGDAYSV